MTVAAQVRTLAAAALVTAGLGCSTSDGGAPTVHDARASEGVEVASVYLEVVGGSGDALVGASTPAAGVVSLHRTSADGAMSAEPSLPLDGTTTLEPGGSHLMLEDLRQPLEPGGTIRLQLDFERADTVALDVPVVAYADLLDGEG